MTEYITKFDEFLVRCGENESWYRSLI